MVVAQVWAKTTGHPAQGSPDLNLTPLAAFLLFCRALRSAKNIKKQDRGVRFKSGLSAGLRLVWDAERVWAGNAYNSTPAWPCYPVTGSPKYLAKLFARAEGPSFAYTTERLHGESGLCITNVFATCPGMRASFSKTSWNLWSWDNFDDFFLFKMWKICIVSGFFMP